MDNSFVYKANCDQPVIIKPRIANVGGLAFFTLHSIDPTAPDQTADAENNPSFTIPVSQLKNAKHGLTRLVLFVRPALQEKKGSATIMLRADQGAALGGTVTDPDGNIQKIPLDENGETVASSSVPNGHTAAFLIGISCK